MPFMLPVLRRRLRRTGCGTGRSSGRCDSYDSRPTACRDYPRALLAQPWPELFEGCGFRVLDGDRAARLAKLRASGLSPEALAETARRLRLE